MPLPTSSTAHASSSQRLEDDVVLQFDATHRLSELTMAWGRLLPEQLLLENSSRLVLLLFISCFLVV
jgi:hypothetical protein